jgi:hypothetical protein
MHSTTNFPLFFFFLFSAVYNFKFSASFVGGAAFSDALYYKMLKQQQQYHLRRQINPELTEAEKGCRRRCIC